MANFEAFRWNISSSINLLFLKSDDISKERTVWPVTLLYSTTTTTVVLRTSYLLHHKTAYLGKIFP